MPPVELKSSPAVRRIEAAHGDVKATLARLAHAGYSRRQAARYLGLGQGTILAWIKRLGVDWPPARYGPKPKRWVRVEGRWFTLAEAAREYGLNVETVWKRWGHGDRSARALLKPCYGNGRSLVAHYATGLSGRDWQAVVDYARKRGADAAYKKFELPKGAVTAALRGEWERCG